MKIILLGQINCGKGTLGENLHQKYGFEAISIGQLLRNEAAKNTAQAKVIDGYLKQGMLVPEEITIKVLKNYLNTCKSNNLIFDGYPRNLVQAKTLENLTKIDAVIVLEVDDAVVMHRALGRRMCKQCGSITHIDFVGNNGNCPKCAGELYIRSDATKEATENKMKSYHIDTVPLIDYFKNRTKVFYVNANNSAEQTFNQVEDVLGLKNRR